MWVTKDMAFPFAIRAVLNWRVESNLRLRCFCFPMLCDWFKKNSHHFLNQSDVEANLIVTRLLSFSRALFSYTYFLRVLICSMDCLSFLWLARVITLALALRPSIKNRSIPRFTPSIYFMWEWSCIKHERPCHITFPKELGDVWKCGQTRSLEFDISSQLKLSLGENGKTKS